MELIWVHQIQWSLMAADNKSKVNRILGNVKITYQLFHKITRQPEHGI